MKKGSKLLLIFIFLITAILGGVAIYIGWRLSQEKEVTPEPGEAEVYVDCGSVGLSCPSGWSPVGSPYCEHPGSNTCKLQCSMAGQADWWQDSGTTCWRPDQTTTSAASTTTSSGAQCSLGCNWMTSGNGSCCVKYNEVCNPPGNDAPVCGGEIDWANVHCGIGQMAFCSGGVQCIDPNTYSCVGECTCNNPGERSGYTLRCFGTTDCICQSGDVDSYYNGNCPGCSNPYGCHACYFQQITTTTPRITTSTPSSSSSSAPSSSSSAPSSSSSSAPSSSSSSAPSSSSSRPSSSSSAPLSSTSISIPGLGVFDSAYKKVSVALILIIVGITFYILNIGTKVFEPALNRLEKWFSKSSDIRESIIDKLPLSKERKKKVFEKKFIKRSPK